MKIGLLTYHHSMNYGAVLQTYATCKILESLGHEVTLINLQNKDTVIGKYRSFRAWLSLPRYLKFWWFRQKYFPRMTRRMFVIKQKFLRPCDCTVVGSDQVWNPNNYTSLDPYFLKFAPQDKTKISYASSFGVGVLTEHTRSYYKDALNSLNAVSVREENAVQLVEDVAGVKAQWVLDPTLLLTGEEWIKYGKVVEGIPDTFVLIYEVTPCAYVKQLALKVAKDLGCKVVRINCDASRQEADDEVLNIMAAGPAEFIWLFSQASMVVTNSFHGTAFSLNMQKDFFVVTPERKQNNSRQKSLLRLVNQENRLIVEGAPMPAKDKFSMNYSTVNPLLAEAREKSINFLKGAIDGK